MVKRWTDRMAGVKYAPRPYEPAIVLERVEVFSHWFYTTHQKKGAVATKLGIGNKKLNRILTLEQLPDGELLKGMMELCDIK
nr:MAG TPA: hypothetical protein [Caudoviricetes sp.]